MSFPEEWDEGLWEWRLWSGTSDIFSLELFEWWYLCSGCRCDCFGCWDWSLMRSVLGSCLVLLYDKQVSWLKQNLSLSMQREDNSHWLGKCRKAWPVQHKVQTFVLLDIYPNLDFVHIEWHWMIHHHEDFVACVFQFFPQMSVWKECLMAYRGSGTIITRKWCTPGKWEEDTTSNGKVIWHKVYLHRLDGESVGHRMPWVYW